MGTIIRTLRYICVLISVLVLPINWIISSFSPAGYSNPLHISGSGLDGSIRVVESSASEVLGGTFVVQNLYIEWCIKVLSHIL